MAIQSDGKIIAVGTALNPTTDNWAFALARYNTDGTLDNSFGENGIVMTENVTGSDGTDNELYAIALQTDGKIVVTGYSWLSTATQGYALARYNTDGTLDATFGTNGTVTDGSLLTSHAWSLGIQSSGRIIIGGDMYNKSMVARYNTNGTVDISFGSLGLVMTTLVSGENSSLNKSIAIQPDGKIVATATVYYNSYINSEFAVARYNSNGSLDISNFASNTGINAFNISGGDGTDEANAMCLQVDGKIIVVGVSNTGSHYGFAIARLNTDGSLDNTFGTNGSTFSYIAGGNNIGGAYAVALQSDGKIVAAGYTKTDVNSNIQPALARWIVDYIYVNATATGLNNGTSWANAYTSLQSALNAAVSGDQIWVAKGTYKPSSSYSLTNTPRYYHFELINNVGIYGGFAGTETSVSQRTNFGYGGANETILSGDIGTPGVSTDNCLHVVYNPGSGISNMALLDGVTITGGNANNGGVTDEKRGGAIYMPYNSPTISNVIITGNYAVYGGGAFNMSSSAKYNNCLFFNNNAGYGGAVMNYSSTSLAFNNCTFYGNNASGHGGGVDNWSSALSYNNSIFWGNTSATGNQIYGYGTSTVTLNYSCYSNSSNDIATETGSSVQTTNNNSTSNPLFVNPATRDFRLYGNSPCVNTGNNSYNTLSTDIRGQARIQNTTIDKGPYEWTSGVDPVYRIIYVNANVSGGAGDGSSWLNAYTSLQSALNTAASGDQIWVAKGTYKPSSAYSLTNAPRYYHFELINNVGIYGGFTGTETSVSQRTDFGYGGANETILSGDIGTPGDNTDNCLHVFYNPSTGITNTALLDGVTITGGNANNAAVNEEKRGGAIYMSSNSPTLSNVIVTGNYAIFGGGACNNNSSAKYNNCLFFNNNAAYGGAVMNFASNSLVFNNCTFYGNTATTHGGGVDHSHSSPSYNNSIFWGNSSATGNQIYGYLSSTITLNYSCFSNSSNDIATETGSSVQTTNYNSTSNPLFVNATASDYRIFGSSPCADAGLDSYNNQSFDIRGPGFGRKLNKSTGATGTIDMGAYEFKLGTDPNAVHVAASSGTTSGDYGTLKVAFDKINDGTHRGTITITVNANTTETASAILNASGSGTSPNISSYTAVNIYPTVTGLTISGAIDGPLVDLNGADYVTIDGRVNATGTVKDLVIMNTSVSYAIGTSTIRFISDASNNIIRYCTLKGSALQGSSGVVCFQNNMGVNGNDNNTIDHNNITSSSNGVRPTAAIASVLLTGTTAISDNNTISNNMIYNFLQPESNFSRGLNISEGATAWTITGNSFYETTSYSPTQNNPNYIIYVSSGANHTISSNSIGGSSPLCGGTWTKTASANNAFYGIYIYAHNAGNEIQGNTIKNISWANTGSVRWSGIYLEGPSVANIGTTLPNVIGEATGNGSITFTAGASDAILYGIYLHNTEATTVANNTIGSITALNTSAANATNICGIYKYGEGTLSLSSNTIGSTDAATTNSIYAGSAATDNEQRVFGINSAGTGTVSISGNTISKLSNGTTNANTATLGLIDGIFISNGTNTVENNTIRDLTIANANTTGAHTASAGGLIFNVGIAVIQTISGNTIYNLSNSNATFAGNVTGLHYNGSQIPGTISGNFIHSLSTSSSLPGASLYGISIIGGNPDVINNIISLGAGLTNGNAFYGIRNANPDINTNLYFNTVDIEGTATGETGNTYAVSDDGLSRDYRNNIFKNGRSGGSTGKHYAVSLTSNTSLTIDYNDYYVPSGVLGFLGSDITTLTGWQAATGGDLHGVNTNPSFAIPGGTLAANYLPSVTSLVAVTGTGITKDYAGIDRSATYPSMGAWEYPVTPPCANPTSGGEIQADQTICSGGDPAELTNKTTLTGETGTLEYKWQISTTNASTGFDDISGAISASYDPPSGLSATSWYKRLTKVTCASEWLATSAIEVTVNPLPTMFNGTGSGSYCAGGEGRLAGLSGSQVGVDYSLWFGVTPVSNVIHGTGGPISFGWQTVAGSYWAFAENVSTHCTNNMDNCFHLTIDPQLPVSVSITPSANPVPAGVAVTFTAAPVNGGSVPSYQWMINGVNVGTNNASYTYIPVNDDEVICVHTSNATCVSGNPASSNTVIMSVSGVPENSTITGIIPDGKDRCYSATQTLTIAGNGTIFIIHDGGSATMIAGHNIIYLPGTTVQSGGYMRGYITSDNHYCTQPPAIPAAATGQDETLFSLEQTNFSIYPNPTNGNFTLVQKGGKVYGTVKVEIYTKSGEKVMTDRMIGEKKHEFLFSEVPVGLYFVKVVADDYIETIKLIKTR
ncbi:MAG: choice-of-anchor Q domain-containing protein [Bacteroidota bacterium]